MEVYTNYSNINFSPIENNKQTELTDSEIEIAKLYKKEQEQMELMLKIARKEGTEEDKKLLKDMITESKANQNSQKLNDYRDVTVINANSMKDFNNKVNAYQKPFSFNLPKQDFSVDLENNSITIGIGSKIFFDDKYLRVASGNVSVFEKGTKEKDSTLSDFDDTGYGCAMSLLLKGVAEKNGKYTHNTADKIIEFLEDKVGIDTSKGFSINGVDFEVVDGNVQTVGYVRPTENKGYNYLQFLLTTATEQNLI